MGILDIQRRFHEVGRIRAGAKSDRGAPKKLETWRLTSANRAALEAAAAVYGGVVRPWDDAPTPGQYELFTEVSALDAVIPPTSEPYSLWYESWSGGGADHRCDGVRDLLNDAPCSCDPENRRCKPTLRVSVMLTKIPGLGVWRYESHGWNAAVEVPTMLDLLALGAKNGAFVPATLRLEQRVSRKKGEGTRRFAVPVIDIQETAGDFTATIASGDPIPPPRTISGTARKEIGSGLDEPLLVPGDEDLVGPIVERAESLGIDAALLPRVYSLVVDRPGSKIEDVREDEVDRLLRSIEKIAEDLPAAVAKIEEYERETSAFGDAPEIEEEA
jgi:hypothetical protein